MQTVDILDIFYNYIVPEASYGRIDCYLFYNIVFKTHIVENHIIFDRKIDNDHLFIPTLMIRNKKKFDQLLIEYVNKALLFYDDTNFEEEVLMHQDYDKKRISKEKVILALLWSNATIEDFNDPISYLKMRIDFLTDDRLQNFFERTEIGYSEILDGNIILKVEKDSITNETPYKLMIKCNNLYGGGILFHP